MKFQNNISLYISGFQLVSSSSIVYSMLSFNNPSIGIPVANSSVLIISIAILPTNENISKLKI